ncbi:MAG: hypothetical protein ABL890_01690 [Candidatus Peribacteraceae bacterium]
MHLPNSSILAQIKRKVLRTTGFLMVVALFLSATIVPQGITDATAHEAPQSESLRLVRLGQRLQNPPRTVRFTSATTTPTYSAVPTVQPKVVATNDSDLLPVVRQKDIKPEHQKLADKVLRALPSGCRDNLKNFYVNYELNPKNRGLGGASTIIVTGNVPDAEFAALITHECGHVIDLGALRGTKESGMSAFVDGSTPMYNNDPSVQYYSISWTNAHTKKTSVKEADFVSGYGASDIFECFAEAFAFFALQNKEFQRLAKTNPALKAKYEFMRDVVFKNTPPLSEGSYVRELRTPWDVTLLPYQLHAK